MNLIRNWPKPLRSHFGFTGFDHVTNQVYIPGDLFNLLGFFLNHVQTHIHIIKKNKETFMI